MYILENFYQYIFAPAVYDTMHICMFIMKTAKNCIIVVK